MCGVEYDVEVVVHEDVVVDFDVAVRLVFFQEVVQ